MENFNISKTIIFIHGAFHGAWCWDKTIEYLEGKGLNCHAIELDYSASKNLTDFANQITNYIASNNLSNTVLVGHSLGGISLQLVTQQLPDKINKLIFLSALVLEDKQSVIDGFSQQTKEYYTKLFEDQDKFIAGFEVAKDRFFNDIEEDEAKEHYKRLREQPKASYLERPNLKRFYELLDELDCTYIVCQKDKAFNEERQLEFAQRLGAKVEKIDTGHEAMLVDPQGLSDIIIKILS